MHIVAIFGVAVALAMDAFAVALATGVNLKSVSPRQTFRLSWHFGLFQAMMPVIGWWLGTSIQSYIESYAHWIAFALLALVGSNMVKEGLSGTEEDEHITKDSTRGMTLVVLSVATSVDALAVGLSMSMMDVAIAVPALIIGIVAGLFTIIGLRLGKRMAQIAWISRWAEAAGGTLLWGIGINILHEHGVFSKFLFFPFRSFV